jgi:hypothetical protein
MKRLPLLLCLLTFGCSTTTSSPEFAREIVSRHLGGDFGTVGPFTKQRKRELEVLAAADQKTALGLLEEGALGFLIYEPNQPKARRVSLVLKDRVVGDYRVP